MIFVFFASFWQFWANKNYFEYRSRRWVNNGLSFSLVRDSLNDDCALTEVLIVNAHTIPALLVSHSTSLARLVTEYFADGCSGMTPLFVRLGSIDLVIESSETGSEAFKCFLK